MDDESTQGPVRSVNSQQQLILSPLQEMETSGATNVRLPRHKIIMIMIAMCLTAMIVHLDETIVSTALPLIATELNASAIEYSWVGSSYLLVSAVFMPLWAPLADTFGRKWIFATGIVLFISGSALSALSNNMAMLISGRAVQGFGGGNILVLINTCLIDLFDPKQRVFYYSVYSGSGLLGASLGPCLGGLLTAYTSWEWIFWINIPVGALSLLLIVVFLSIPRPAQLRQMRLRDVDWAGCVLIAIATTLFLVGLQAGGVLFPWNSAQVIAMLIAGPLIFLAFVVQQRRSCQPVMPTRLFSDSSVLACLATDATHGFVFMSVVYYLPLYFQEPLDAPPEQAGLWLLITAIPSTIVTIASALLIQRTARYRPVIWTSSVAMTLGVGLMIGFPSHRSWPRIVLFQLVVATGVGPLFIGPLIAYQARLLDGEAATGSATYALVQRIACAIGLVLGQVVMQSHMRGQSGILLDADVPSEVLPVLTSTFTARHISVLTPAQITVFERLLTSALSYAWVLNTAVAGLGILPTLFIKHKDM